MAPHTDDDNEPSRAIGLTLGFKWLADLKLQFGRWLETHSHRRSDQNAVYTGGFVRLADLKIRFGKWLEQRRNP